MTIRFTCAECLSVLKIKDELAGTSGRCPKCKTKFVVPAPPSVDDTTEEHGGVLSGADGSESTERAASDPKQLSDQVPISNHPITDLPDLAENRLHAVTSELSSSEMLRLDDSDDARDVADESSAEDEGPHASNRVSVAKSDDSDDSDDDDLDSPSVMVSNPKLSHKMTSLPIEATRDNKESVSSGRGENGSKPSRPTSKEEPFDPLKFLMADRPINHLDSLSSNTSRDDESPDLSLSGDSDDDLSDRPSPRPINRSTPPVAASRATPEKVDLATAAKMMKKAIKDSQAEAAHQREMDAKAGFDYGQMFREFGLRGLAVVVGGIILVSGLYFATNRMFSSPLKLPKLGYVKGTVKLDGKPLSGAMVNFAPTEVEMAGSKRERIRTSVGVTDDKGEFRMMYMPAEKIEGVAVGRCKVWVTHIGEKGNDVPAEWTEGALLVKEVTAGSQKDRLDINMESKTR